VGYSQAKAINWANGVSSTGVSPGYDISPLAVGFNSSGTPQWASSPIAAGRYAYYSGVQIDSSGNAYVTGYLALNGTWSWAGGVSVHGASSQDWSPVLIKYNSSGVAQWAQSTTSGDGECSFYSLALDSTGSNIYTVGRLYSAIGQPFAFGGNASTNTNSSNGPYNSVIVKFNSSGVGQWAQTITNNSQSNASSRFNGITVSNSGSIYVFGSVRTNANSTYSFTFPSNNPISANANVISVTNGLSSASSTAMMAKYDVNGNALWAYAPSGAQPGDSSFMGGIAMLGANLFVGGTFSASGNYNLGGGVSTPSNTFGESLLIQFNP
jgi:hypothetical protein